MATFAEPRFAGLRDTFREGLAPRSTKMKALLVEVALIRGINDQRHHAECRHPLLPGVR